MMMYVQVFETPPLVSTAQTLVQMSPRWQRLYPGHLASSLYKSRWSLKTQMQQFLKTVMTGSERILLFTMVAVSD